MVHNIHFKSDILIHVISALSKFQNSTRGELILEAFLKGLNDKRYPIRCSIIDLIDVNGDTLPYITNKLHDIHPKVRHKTYIRLGIVAPFMIDILNGLFIIKTGLNEDKPEMKRVFRVKFLKKWLAAYDNNYSTFLKALISSFTENDLFQLTVIGKEVLHYLFESTPVSILLAHLPIDEEKLLRESRFIKETVFYWYCLVDYFHSNNLYNDYLSQVLPNLTQFCKYIERKFTEDYMLDENTVVEFEFIIYCLIKILNCFDFSYENRRQTTSEFISNTITKYRFRNRKLTEIFIEVLSKCYININRFLSDVDDIITNIREPFVETLVHLSESEIADRQNKISECMKYISVLESAKKEYLYYGNHGRAREIHVSINILNNKLAVMHRQFGYDITTTIRMIRTERNDHFTVCHYLEVLFGVLQLDKINKSSPYLMKILNNVLLTLSRNTNDDIHSRYLECLIKYCIIDKQLALRFYQEIIEPIDDYKYLNESYLASLKIALIGFADLLCRYNVDIIRSEPGECVSMSDILACGGGIRNAISTVLTFSMLNSTLEVFTIDDEDLIITALETLCKLIKIIKFESHVISHLLLKWLDPLIKNNHYEIYTKIGHFLDTFIKFSKNSFSVLRQSIVPVLITVFTAANDTSISLIEFDIVINFFVTWLNTGDQSSIQVSVFDMIGFISDASNKRIIRLLYRILFRLNVVFHDIRQRDLAINFVELRIDEVEDIVIKRYLRKCIENFRKAPISPYQEDCLTDLQEPYFWGDGNNNVDIGETQTKTFTIDEIIGIFGENRLQTAQYSDEYSRPSTSYVRNQKSPIPSTSGTYVPIPFRDSSDSSDSD